MAHSKAKKTSFFCLNFQNLPGPLPSDAHGYSYCLSSGTPERGALRGTAPLTFKKGGNGGTGALTYQYHK